MKRLFLIALMVCSNVINATNQDYVVETSIQLPIRGELQHSEIDGKVEVDPNQVTYIWPAKELQKFEGYNTFIIHPINSDYKLVSYKVDKHTLSYLDRAVIQAKNVYAAHPQARIYIGLPHATESDNVPTNQEIRDFFYTFSEKFHAAGLYKKITGLYVTDELYNAGVTPNSNKIENPAKAGDNIDFQYFVNLRHVMNEYAVLNNMPVMWMPQYTREKAHSKISNLIQWQNTHGFTLFERIVVQPGYYAGKTDESAVNSVMLWALRNNVNGQSHVNTKIGAMLEYNAGIDWCLSSSILKTANDTHRPRYTQQHNKFVSLVGEADVNLFFDIYTSEWRNNTLDWETNSQAENPYGVSNIFSSGQSIVSFALNQPNICN